MSKSRQSIIRSLRALEKEWPDDGLMIMANGNFLYPCTKHPQAGGKVLETFYIPSDGGDPDWQDGQRDDERPKRLPQFKPPSTTYIDAGVKPPPRFSGDKS